jgi:hypothetical protein
MARRAASPKQFPEIAFGSKASFGRRDMGSLLGRAGKAHIRATRPAASS